MSQVPHHLLEQQTLMHLSRRQNISYAVGFVDADLVIQSSNLALTHWFAEDAEVGASLLDLFPELVGYEDDLAQMAQGQLEPFTIAQIYRRIREDDRYFDLSIEPFTGFGLGVLVFDVTEYTRVLQELQQQRNELKLTIIERERMAAERERLINDLDAFAHMVAHDLKNPLSNIMGYASIMAEDFAHMDPNELEHCINAIIKSSNRMREIIEALLMLAKVRKDDTMDFEPLDMTQIISDAQDRIGHQILASGANIQITSELLPAIGYAPWVAEIWVNYISNAIKYGGKPPRITIESQLAPDNPALVEFWLEDNGLGLTREQQARLFTPFTRFHHDASEGHGLGLSIVKRIAEKLGGTVMVESDGQGQGSRFGFALPAA